ncbi:thioesterase domain-containing protein [Streptomyces sp. NBC_00287]|uniref:thioesterase II family protein n=1 Tax=Streptomyces sp. NBC_00287 TaxID=2975702 RepID=UPI002E2DB534|nr:thioesterase domain-containing protein [Streptomyces sp. NBC_00287]
MTTPLRLLCFPYAGAGGSLFARWQGELADRGCPVEVVPVRLPGREGRAREPRFTELAPLVRALEADLTELLDEPHLMYGHSMGALVGYALTLRRQAGGAVLPRALLLAAHRAPHLPAPHIAPIDAPDAELAAALARLGGLPPLLLNHPEWLRALLPIIRDDLRVCADAASLHPQPVRVPLHLFAGEEDILVRVPEVLAWRRYAGLGCELRTVPGGHFFPRTHEGALLDEVACVVKREVTPRGVYGAA